LPSIKQDRRLTVRSSKLQSAGGGHVGGLYLGNDASERAVAQRVFGHCEHFAVLAPLCVNQLLGAKARLLQSGRIEIEAGCSPEGSEVRLICKTRRDVRQEQRGRGVVTQARRCCSEFVKSAAIKTSAGKAVVNSRDIESQHGTPACTRRCKPRAKRGEHLGRRPRQ